MAKLDALTALTNAGNWRAAILAGLIAAVAFAVLETALGQLTGGEAFAPFRMIAAIALGEAVLSPPAAFETGILLAALGVHLPLAVICGLIFAFVAARLGLRDAMIAGAVFGLVIYVVNFYGFTQMFPWFAMARGWVSLTSHIAFGVALAWAYKRFEPTPLDRA